MMVILIIVGQAGGNIHTNKGGGSNYLCLPSDPDNGKPYSYGNDVLSKKFDIENKLKIGNVYLVS
jgi:hypothetical protein